ncbi:MULTISPECIES: restriction endonuclease subunit S [unclassified Psychrobacter]|uniref:restriction endonuclease subunit S n=1 Tax=unclassified Psychrobacter TaxID=196806 RepID=UPI003F47AE3D
MAELIMKYQQYAEYKDSGVEWLGKVPKDWSTISLKRKASFITGMTPSTAISAYYSDDVTIYEWVRPEDIKENTEKVCGTKYLTELGWQTQRKVAKNSVLLCCIGTIGKAGYASKTVTTNQQITAVSFKDNSKYNYYLLLAARNELEQMATGNVVKILNSERLGQLSIPKVDLYQANQIAKFLDHETAQIDTLIEKQQTLIQLLKEKRQAVISHAVTKGLNPNAPMKDSGVEWLGEVPEHWEVSKLKFESEIIDCRNKTPEYFENGEYFVVRTTNVRHQKLNFNGALYTDKKNFDIWTQRGVPPAGSIFFTREAPTGEVCLVPENLKFCMGQRMMNFIAHDKSYTNYLFDYLISDCLDRYINSVSHGSTVSHLRVEQVQNIPVLVPPLDEIAQIHNHIEKLKLSFDDIELNAKKAIQLMQERRTALISAAVTGKINVRGWVAPE